MPRRHPISSEVASISRSTRSKTKALQIQQQEILGAEVGVIAQIVSQSPNNKRRRITIAEAPESRKRYKGYAYETEMTEEETEVEKKKNPPSIFEVLPVELFQIIISHMDARSMLSLFQCRKGVAVLLSSGLWQQAYIQKHTGDAIKSQHCCPLGHMHEVDIKRLFIYSPVMSASKSMINYPMSWPRDKMDLDVIKGHVYDWKTQFVLSSNFIDDASNTCTMCGNNETHATTFHTLGIRLCKACCFQHLVPRSLVHTWCLREDQLNGLPYVNLISSTESGTHRRDATYWFSRHLKALQQQAYPSKDVLNGKLAEIHADVQELRDEFERRDAILDSLIAGHGFHSFTELYEFIQTLDHITRYDLLSSLSEYYQRGTRKQTKPQVSKRGRKSKKNEESDSPPFNPLLVSETKARCTPAEATKLLEALQTALNKLDRRRARHQALEDSLKDSKYLRATLETSIAAKQLLIAYVAGETPPKTFDALGDVDEIDRARFTVQEAIQSYQRYELYISSRNDAIERAIPTSLNETNYFYAYDMDKKAWKKAFETHCPVQKEASANHVEVSVYAGLSLYRRPVLPDQIEQRKARLIEEIKKIDPKLEAPLQTFSEYFEQWRKAMSVPNKHKLPPPPAQYPAEAAKAYIKILLPNVTHRMTRLCHHNNSSLHLNRCISIDAPDLGQLLAMRSMHHVDEFIRTILDGDFQDVSSLGNEEAKALYQKLAKQTIMLTKQQAPLQAKHIWRMESVHRCLRLVMPKYTQPSSLGADAYSIYIDLCNNEDSLLNKCKEIEKLEKTRLKRRNVAIKAVKQCGVKDPLLEEFEKSTKLMGTHRSKNEKPEDWMSSAKVKPTDVIMIEWIHSTFPEETLKKAMQPKLAMQIRIKKREELAQILANSEIFIRSYCLNYSLSKWAARGSAGSWAPNAQIMDDFASISTLYYKYIYKDDATITAQDVVYDLTRILEQMHFQRPHRMDFVKQLTAFGWQDLVWMP